MTDISLKDLADILVLSERTIQKSAKEGIIVRASAVGKYVLEESIKNYVVHLRETASGRANLPDESARLKSAQAEYYDLKNAKTRGELVSAADVTAAMRSDYRTTAQKILQIPSKVAPRVAVMKTAAEVEDLLHREFGKALTALSQEAADQLRKFNGS